MGNRAPQGVFLQRRNRKRTESFLTFACSINVHVQEPVEASLPSAASFADVECPSTSRLHVGSLDVANAFDGMAVPESLAHEFSLPSIRAKHLSFLNLEEWGFADHAAILPCLRVLPWAGAGRFICAKL